MTKVGKNFVGERREIKYNFKAKRLAGKVKGSQVLHVLFEGFLGV